MSLITVLNGCTGKSPDEIVSLLNNNGWEWVRFTSNSEYNAKADDLYVWAYWDHTNHQWSTTGAGRGIRLSTLRYTDLIQSHYLVKPYKEYEHDPKLPPHPDTETATRWRAGIYP